jgi:hypothetical protein
MWGERRQDKLSLHHINGDDTDDRVANVIPLCQSCHVYIHKVDEPPYRQWHRQLPIDHRNAWNAHYKEYYEGPRLNSKQAEWFFGDDDATPRSEKYRRHEPTDPDQDSSESDPDDDASSADAQSDTTEAETASAAADDPELDKAGSSTAPGFDDGTVTIEFAPAKSVRQRLRFVDRDDGPGWWRLDEKWTGCRWRTVGREPVTEVEVTDLTE